MFRKYLSRAKRTNDRIETNPARVVVPPIEVTDTEPDGPEGTIALIVVAETST
jgi:hypothetical protein